MDAISERRDLIAPPLPSLQIDGSERRRSPGPIYGELIDGVVLVDAFHRQTHTHHRAIRKGQGRRDALE